MPSRAARQGQRGATSRNDAPSSADEARSTASDTGKLDEEMKTPSPNRRRLRRDPANRKVDYADGGNKRRVGLLLQARSKLLSVINELREEREKINNYDLQAAVDDALARYPKEWHDKTLEELDNVMQNNVLPEALVALASQPKTIAARTLESPNVAGTSDKVKGLPVDISTGLIRLASTSQQVSEAMHGSNIRAKQQPSSTALAPEETISDKRTQPSEPLTNEKQICTVGPNLLNTVECPKSRTASEHSVHFEFTVPRPPPPLPLLSLTTPSAGQIVPFASTLGNKTNEKSGNRIVTGPHYFCIVHTVKDLLRNLPQASSLAVKFFDVPGETPPRATELFEFVKSPRKPVSALAGSSSRSIMLLLAFPDTFRKQDGTTVTINIRLHMESVLREFATLLKEFNVSAKGNASSSGPPLQCAAGFVAVPLNKLQVQTVSGEDAAGAIAAANEEAQKLRLQLFMTCSALQTALQLHHPVTTFVAENEYTMKNIE